MRDGVKITIIWRGVGDSTDRLVSLHVLAEGFRRKILRKAQTFWQKSQCQKEHFPQKRTFKKVIIVKLYISRHVCVVWLPIQGTIWERKLTVEMSSVLFGNLIVQIKLQGQAINIYVEDDLNAIQSGITVCPVYGHSLLTHCLTLQLSFPTFSTQLTSSNSLPCRLFQGFGFNFYLKEKIDAIRWQLFLSSLAISITPPISVPIFPINNKELLSSCCGTVG